MRYKNVFCSSTHLIDTVDEIYTKLASGANSSHGSGCVTGMNEYKSLYKTDFWPNCKHESSGGSLVTLRTSTGKSSPFTLRYWPSMKWTPSQADLMPVYVLEKKLWNYKFSIFECHAMNFTKRIKHYIITMIIFNNKKKKSNWKK